MTDPEPAPPEEPRPPVVARPPRLPSPAEPVRSVEQPQSDPELWVAVAAELAE